VEGFIARGYDVTIYHRGVHEVEFSKPVTHIHGDPFSKEALAKDLPGQNYDVVVSSYGRLRYVAKVMSGKTRKFVGITGGASYVGYRNLAHTRDGLPVPISEEYATYTRREDDAYGWAVAEGERQLMAQHENGEFDVTIFRYPNVYGPRANRSVIWSIMKRALDKRPYIIVPGNGDRLRNRGYIDNLTHAVFLSLDTPQASGQIYNICDERTLTLAELVTCIAACINHDWEVITVAHPIVEELCRGYVSESHHQLFDLTKAKRELGYRDVVSAPEAVRRTVQWHLDNRDMLESMVEEEKEGKPRRDPYAYDLEDRLVALHKEYARSVSAAIPSLGRRRG
jgi:nucleoside-diphosphate-sugar epimerase